MVYGTAGPFIGSVLKLFEAIDQRGGMLPGTGIAPRSHGPGRFDVIARVADTIIARDDDLVQTGSCSDAGVFK